MHAIPSSAASGHHPVVKPINPSAAKSGTHTDHQQPPKVEVSPASKLISHKFTKELSGVRDFWISRFWPRDLDLYISSGSDLSHWSSTDNLNRQGKLKEKGQKRKEESREALWCTLGYLHLCLQKALTWGVSVTRDTALETHAQRAGWLVHLTC